MKYLLDVNVLVALGFMHHEFHDRVALWLRNEKSPQLLTCSITELGFVRVLSQVPGYTFTTQQARSLLLKLKKNQVIPLEFVADANDISNLPAWVKTPKQATDGHLLQLAVAHGGVLAALDRAIPGSYLIP
jgi:predicted nucleic acid-binding protein